MARLSRAWLRRVEQAASGEMISIPQADGTVAEFPESQLPDAYLNATDRALGRDVATPEHPMLTAMRNSPDPRWRDVWTDLLDSEGFATDDEPEDLSEPSGRL